MDLRRVALIFDDRDRPETTGVYCKLALRSLVDVEHFQPEEFERIPRTGFDLYVNIDDGLDYRLPNDLQPSAWWAIDTHLSFARCLERARTADLVFAAQRNGAERLQAEGITTAHWLPLACDPEIHRKFPLEKTHDVTFIGNLFPGPRADLLKVLDDRFRKVFVGRAYFEEMARAYSSSRIVFNRSLEDDINMRVFEALACGSLLMTNDLTPNGQATLFRDDLHLATYSDAEELVDKVAYYLAHDAVREKIAAAGRALVLAKHTYRHRMETLLRVAEQVVSPVRVQPALRLVGEEATDAKQSSLVEDPEARVEMSSGYGGYYEFTRPELLALIPQSAQRVLDVGCGAGRLGETLKSRQDAEVVGIELSAEAATRARGRLDRVIVGDVERLELDFMPGSFDAVVCGDVLEHLRNPEAFLAKVHTWLRPNGILVVSIPNVQHQSIASALLAGNWTYESAGLMDRTHLSFFTRLAFETLLDRSGFQVSQIGFVPGPGYEEWVQQGRPGGVRIGGLHVSGLAPEDAQEFFAYQYLVTAQPQPACDVGLTSIIVRTFNERDATQRCLDSLREHTHESYELIVIDNGSTDGSVEYLRSQPDITLIANGENRGIPAAANQGIRASQGRQVVLLDNDTIVTPGWLKRLLAPLQRPEVGLVGPSTNWPQGNQQITPGYRDLIALDRFAWDWSKAQAGQYREVDELSGFCLLIRRDLIDRLGFFDESYGLGICEDKDYSRRSLQAGYRNVIAQDVFVHHEGHRTFVANRIDAAGLFARNRRRFHETWDPILLGSPRDAMPKVTDGAATPLPPGSRSASLRIAYLSHFGPDGRTEEYAASAMERLGHSVLRIQESQVSSADAVLGEIETFQADCLLFFKGRIGVDPRDLEARLRPDPSRLLDVLRRCPVPAFMWYFDKVHGYDAEPSRLAWMRRVAPLCRIAFVTDGGLATTDWANWHVLRAGISRPTVAEVNIPEHDRQDLAFLGQLYGERWDELEPVRHAFRVHMISQVFGRDLSTVMRKHRIILGPKYPNAPSYWSDRIYIVLGHGGFFLAPEVPGMREEGFEPGVHYAALGDDPVRDIRYWLDRPEEREHIARQGQELVLSRFTYDDRARDLCAVIAQTLSKSRGTGSLPFAQDRSIEPVTSSPTHETAIAENRYVRESDSDQESLRPFGSHRNGPALRFRHRRKLGDIIYSLPAVRHLGGGILYLDPTGHDGALDQAYWRQQFAQLIPFLKKQPYLQDVRLYEGDEFDMNLDAYLRTSHGMPGDQTTITANHFLGLGIEPPEVLSPWLQAGTCSAHYPIVIHHSHRYHGSVDYSFLHQVTDQLYCVGSPEERAPFEAIGASPIVTEDVTSLAAVINSCGVFIGNQSLPLALAIGLGRRRMLEASAELPNCIYGGDDEFVMTDSADQNLAALRRLLEQAKQPPEIFAEVHGRDTTAPVL